MSQSNPIFVTGATGNVGRHVVKQLLAKGACVRALTRNPDSAALPPEVQVVQGDPATPETFDQSLDGVDAVFLVWRSSSASAGAFVKAAAKQAKRLVFLSSSAIQDGVDQHTNPIARMHADIESEIQSSSLTWTFLRAGGFAANARAWFAPQIRLGDVVRWPYPNATSSPIHEADIASVAVRALTEPGHAGAQYHLTGPESLTLAEQVRTIAEVIGRPLRYEEISREAARQQFVKMMPPQIVDMLLGVWEKSAGTTAPVTQTVAELTGAPAHTFSQWVADHASEFELRAATEGGR